MRRYLDKCQFSPSGHCTKQRRKVIILSLAVDVVFGVRKAESCILVYGSSLPESVPCTVDTLGKLTVACVRHRGD